MTARPTVIDASANHAWLTGEFLRLLFLQEPGSVLDVGCGSGELLRACAERGVEATGLDRPGPRLDALRETGLHVREGTAYALPRADRSVDWVTLRHLPHHLEDPVLAFAESLRVARVGLLLAEPWFDATLSSQRGALAVDRWEKRQDRLGGMFHAEVLDLGALLAALPNGSEEELEVEAAHCLRLRRRSIEDFAREAEQRLLTSSAGPDEHTRLADLLEEIGGLGLTWNGSLCVTLRRRTRSS